MRCSHCGHENPGPFKFCGMCGNKLVAADAPVEGAATEKDLAATRVPWPPQEITPVSGRVNRRDTDRPPQSSDSQRAAEDFLRKRPAPTPPPEEEEPARLEAERSTEIHGPSFLGLSGSSDSTAYLLEDEGGGSNAVRIVFLLILLAAAAVVWWKWEPIKTYVWTQASMHAQEAKPAAANPQTDASTADSSKPADTTQSLPQTDKPQMSTDAATGDMPATSKSQAAAPGAAGDKPADTAAASKPAGSEAKPDATADKSASTGQDAASADSKDNSADDSKDSSAAKAAPEPKTSKPKAKAEDEAADAEAPAPPARKAAPKPQPDSGADLLAKAENYLYGRGGVPKSCRQALVYFKAAADRQNPAALSHVGAMYATGECGVRVDRVQAYKWFSKAYELQPSNSYLERNLTMLWREMSDQERQAVTRPSTTRGQ